MAVLNYLPPDDEYGERGVVVETVGFVQVRHQFGGDAEGRHHHVRIDPKHLSDGDLNIGQVIWLGLLAAAVGLFGWHLLEFLDLTLGVYPSGPTPFFRVAYASFTDFNRSSAVLSPPFASG